MLTEEDLKQIEKIAKRNNYSDELGCLTVLFFLFCIGFFKGC